MLLKQKLNHLFKYVLSRNHKAIFDNSERAHASKGRSIVQHLYIYMYVCYVPAQRRNELFPDGSHHIVSVHPPPHTATVIPVTNIARYIC